MVYGKQQVWVLVLAFWHPASETGHEKQRVSLRRVSSLSSFNGAMHSTEGTPPQSLGLEHLFVSRWRNSYKTQKDFLVKPGVFGRNLYVYDTMFYVSFFWSGFEGGSLVSVLKHQLYVRLWCRDPLVQTVQQQLLGFYLGVDLYFLRPHNWTMGNLPHVVYRVPSPFFPGIRIFPGNHQTPRGNGSGF